MGRGIQLFMGICFRPDKMVLVLMLASSSCAIQVAPSGGEKDVKPPVTKKTEPLNYATRFTGPDINISFDEYIALKDLSSQFLVSPPLRNQPDVKVKKKTLSIHLQDTLLSNTTYTMNFGNAITDLREGNAIEDYQFVFSTGDIIDSLTVSGKAENALDKKTEKGIYVMLYSGSDDSLPLKMLPSYFSKTAGDGTFEIRNVAPGSYKVFALKDNNTNFLFDNPEETIAFNDEPVEAGHSAGTMRYFKERRDQQLLRAACDEPGYATIIYARPLDKEKITFLSDTSGLQLYSVIAGEKRDTLNFWYRNLQGDSLNMILQHGQAADTISIRLKQYVGKTKSRAALALTTQFTSGSQNTLDLNKPVELLFNHPIDSFGFGNISVREDSLLVNDAKFYFTDTLKRNLVIDFPRKEKTVYSINIYPSTFRDIFGLRNDTLLLTFRTKTLSDYGTMEVKLDPGTQKSNFIVQLIDDKEKVYRQSFFHSDTTLNYDYLEPRIYRLKIIEDLNGNNEWDTGNYLQHLQPERVFYYQENLTVRANWDVEVKWEVGK